MGGSQTKDKSSPTEKVVEGLKDKVRVLQGEVNEIMGMRERESQVYEREVVVFAFKQAEWRRERKRLKEELKRLRRIQEEKDRPSSTELEKKSDNSERCESYADGANANTRCCVLEQIKEEQARRDEALEKWKQLYFAIKVELDDLIQRTYQDGRLCRRTDGEDVLLELKKEVTTKEERIELLQAKIASMEHHQLKRERDMDILRQSLRIMSHKKRSTPKPDPNTVQGFDLLCATFAHCYKKVI